MFQMASFHNEKSHLGKLIRKEELDSFTKRIKLIHNRKNNCLSSSFSKSEIIKTNILNRSASTNSKFLFITILFGSFDFKL